MIQLDKLKQQVKTNLKYSFSKKKLLVVFDRKSFKKNISFQGCVSYTDLKPTPKILYDMLVKKYKDKIAIEPHYNSPDDFTVTLWLMA
jgi:hypothetical protein